MNAQDRLHESHESPRGPLPDGIQHEDLVAYLDGEVDEQLALRIEAAVADDVAVQAQLNALDATWGLLDSLPTPIASEELTQRTIQSLGVIAAAPSAFRQHRSSVAKWVRLLVWGGGILLSTVAGFSLTFRDHSRQDRELIRDWPVIQQLKDYTRIGSVEYLDELRDEEVFRESSENE